ncbi:MAG TPA: TRAP transporter small permease, partial [Steroidobacteraceae bacterium]
MKRIEAIIANLFGVIFLGLAAVVTIETLSRKLFNFSLQGADELGGYALAVGSTLAFSLALIGRNHIRVDVFHELLPRRVKAALNWLSIVLLAAMAILFVAVSLRVLQESLEYRSTA